MATGMQPKELGINYLVLCDNTKTQKVSSKSMTMRAKLGSVVTENCYKMLIENLAERFISAATKCLYSFRDENITCSACYF